MTYDEATKFFGSGNKLAKALGVHQTSTLAWKSRIPTLRQLQIERLSKGELKADDDCDDFRAPRRRRQAAEQVG